MGALGNGFKNLSEGWKNLSSRRKIAIIVLAGGVISALLFFMIFLGKPKYEPLFLNMPPEDMAKVVEKLKQEKVSYKPDGNTILVPREKVEELRLSVVSSGIMPSNGKGFELFDESRFGMTDTETKIFYQRALETEIERTIKAFDEIEYARVHLVLPEPSVFVRNEEPARASVTLKLKSGRKLSPADVKTMVALVSGSVKNLSKENVEVVDTNFNLLSENLYNNDMSSPGSLTDRYQIGRQFETKISNDLKAMLEPVFGPGKVKVSVNADLDFDSKQITSIKYDSEGILKSQHKINETITGGSGSLSSSPIDNNMSNDFQSGNTEGDSSKTRQEETQNFNVGQTEEKTIKAPGQVKRMSTSVVIDGTLSQAVKASVRNIVASATGFNEDRGDLISVEGIPFDDTIKKRIEADLKEMQDKQKIAERNKKYIMYIGYPLAGIIGLILLLVLISRIRSGNSRKKTAGLDVVIDEPVAVNEIIKRQSIFDEEENQNDLTSELKKYASKKPDQVIEIIKSWLAEDER